MVALVAFVAVARGLWLLTIRYYNWKIANDRWERREPRPQASFAGLPLHRRAERVRVDIPHLENSKLGVLLRLVQPSPAGCDFEMLDLDAAVVMQEELTITLLRPELFWRTLTSTCIDYLVM